MSAPEEENEPDGQQRLHACKNTAYERVRV